MVSKTKISAGRNVLLLVVLIILLLTGCTPSSILVSPTPIRTAATTIAPTASLTPVPSSTPTETLMPIISQTPPPSLTPLPTISFDRFAWKSEVLLATNGGCRLPCYWGMTPGKTTVDELKQFLAQFPGDFPEGVLKGQRRSYTLFYYLPRMGDSSWAVTFSTDPSRLTSVFLTAETAQYSFPLAKILSDYGMPEQVFISPPAPEEFDGDLVMIVLYEKQQFAARYILSQHELDKTLYCYDPQSWSQYLVTWAPGEDWLDLLQPKPSILKPLTEVSDYNIPALREKLKVPNRALCLHVQADKIAP